MSFFGCIGDLMSDTGICEALEVVYFGKRKGKAVTRTLRDHQLLELVLNTFLLEDLLLELDVDFSVFKKIMTDAKNDR